MITDNLILIANDDLVSEMVDFFTAQKTNPELFEEIKKICTEYSNRFKKTNGEIFINMGFLSCHDFLMYLTHKKKINGGIKTQFVDIIIKQLVKYYIVIPMDSIMMNHQDQRYQVSGNFAVSLHQRDLIKNLLYGFNYIINRYRNSVVKIEHINNDGDTSIGTGFLIFEESKHLIITNRHVVEKSARINVYTHDDKEIFVKNVFEDDERDIAIIEIEKYGAVPFLFSDELEVMKEIITIGYPTIPTTKFAYQVYHKGEVNSFVEDYWNNKLFLISAKTSSGNSGSPIIDNTGMVVGIITEELFEKDKFYEKGKLPYYAGIPYNEIIESITKRKLTMANII